MCSKLFTARAEKSGSVDFSPHKNTSKLSVAEEETAGKSTPLESVTDYYHTVLLFHAPFVQAQIIRVCNAYSCEALLAAQGLHGDQLRQAVSTGQLCHYEWNLEHNEELHPTQTTLVPLTGETGKVTEVISVSRDISHWGAKTAHSLREGTAPKTFAQILLATREHEKREIAKALHDELGSASVILAALLSVVKQNVSKRNTKQALQDLEQLNRQIQDCIGRMHTIVVSLRPPGLDTDGALRGNIEELTQQVGQFAKLACTFDCPAGLREKGISDSVKILVYRVVQEALNNVVKHAKATCVKVGLRRRKGQLYVSVQDDGIGFERKKQVSLQHMGLLSMRDSIRLLSGRLTITTAPGKGTRIAAVCPCVVYEDNDESKNCISR